MLLRLQRRRDRTPPGLSGTEIQSYQAMADRSVPPLTTAAASDTTLAAHATTAAALTQAGAARMDQIAATTSTITKAAPMAKSAAGQRVILTALRSQVSQASQVVQSSGDATPTIGSPALLLQVTTNVYYALWTGPAHELARHLLSGRVKNPWKQAANVLGEAAWTVRGEGQT